MSCTQSNLDGDGNSSQKGDNCESKHIFHQQTVFTIESEIRSKTQKCTEEYKKTKLCANRECKNSSGSSDKPHSIYCSAKCQYRGMIVLCFFFFVFLFKCLIFIINLLIIYSIIIFSLQNRI